ncbi:hypothetical protein [Paenisporosarcina sp. NPDC076898]|uniref:hypothetical protein n=1 Tax=unclassified Paenisporosarcina TaxID=2642018 RepID=UPI003CFC6D9C
MKKIVSVISLLFLFSLVFTPSNAEAKVMWGKTELKVGQLGKVIVLTDTNLYKIKADQTLSVVRLLKKGDEYRVYSFKNNHGGLYGVGGGTFIQKALSIKYETPSKNKLALLALENNVDSKEPKDLKTYETEQTPYEFYSFHERFKTISDGWEVYQGTTYDKVYTVLGKPYMIRDLTDSGYPGVTQWKYQHVYTHGGSYSIDYVLVYFYNGKVISSLEL